MLIWNIWSMWQTDFVGLRRTPFKSDCDQGYSNARLGLKPRTWKLNKMFADEEVRLDVMSKPHTKFDFLSRDEFPTDYWLDNQERNRKIGVI